jgi:hypothetical protein
MNNDPRRRDDGEDPPVYGELNLSFSASFLKLVSAVWCATVEGSVGAVFSELTMQLEFVYHVVLCRNRFPALLVNEIEFLILPCFGARKGVDFGSDRVVGRVIVHDLHEMEMV